MPQDTHKIYYKEGLTPPQHIIPRSFYLLVSNFSTKMVVGSCIDEITLNVCNSRLWKGAICDAYILYPKLLPDFFAKGERVGEGVGSINILHFAPGLQLFSFYK